MKIWKIQILTGAGVWVSSLWETGVVENVRERTVREENCPTIANAEWSAEVADDGARIVRNLRPQHSIWRHDKKTQNNEDKKNAALPAADKVSGTDRGAQGGG